MNGKFDYVDMLQRESQLARAQWLSALTKPGSTDEQIAVLEQRYCDAFDKAVEALESMSMTVAYNWHMRS